MDNHQLLRARLNNLLRAQIRGQELRAGFYENSQMAMVSSLFSRQDFPTFERCCYLNQASLGLLGGPVVQAMHRFIDEYARHGNCYMSDDDEAYYLDSLRALGATMLSCPKPHVAVVGCASEILAQLPLMIERPQNGNIVAVGTDFPAVTRPWLREQQFGRGQVRFVDDVQSASLTDALLDRIDESTAVVAVSSVQFATGTRVDVQRISDAASNVGAHLIVDVTQELGARRVEIGAWNADAVVCSGYKWLGGHGGVAMAAMSPRLLDRVPPLTGWMGAPNAFDFDARSLPLAGDARRYTQSTMSYASVAGLMAALREILRVGSGSIEAHADQLGNLLVEELGKHGWHPFRQPGDSSTCSHIIALADPDREPEESAKKLAERNIVCSVRGGRIRVSIAPYNDENDIDMITQVLK